MQPARSKQAVLLVFLCACGQKSYKLGESDGQVAPESGAGAGGSTNVGGSGGAGVGGGGTLGSGATGGGGTLGNGGTPNGDGSIDTGGSCPGASTGDPAPWWRNRNSPGCETEGMPSPADRPAACLEAPSQAPIYLGISRIRLGAVNDDAALSPNPQAWRDIGFDLDRACTQSGTCQAGVDSGLVDEQACRTDPLVSSTSVDGNQCRDNAFGQLFALASESPQLARWFGLTERDWNCELHRGGLGILFRISEYNGTRDDPQVRVDVYSTAGLRVLPSWSCREPSGNSVRPDWSAFAPWAPTAHWKVLRRSLATGEPGIGIEAPNARYSDPVAFVRNGYLFAALPPGSELWLNGSEQSSIPGFRFVIHRGVLTGALVREPNNQMWTLDDGTLGGFLYPSDIVNALREGGVCENMCDTYTVLADFVYRGPDALAGTPEIRPGPPCDAWSFGAKFEARQTRATAQDIVDGDPVTCPNPKYPDAPRMGCVCLPQGGCVLPDAGDGGGP